MCDIICKPLPPVAQLDNAADSDSEEWGFKSLRAGHAKGTRKRAFCNEVATTWLMKKLRAYANEDAPSELILNRATSLH